MRILAVDDEPAFLQLLDRFLKDIGYRDVVFCDSGAKALDLMQTDASGFSCLLIDIQMPEMDGIELCQRVRSIPGYARTPILMLTAMAETRYIDSAFLAGASDYITKPLKRAELTARLSLAQTLNQDRTRHVSLPGGRGSHSGTPSFRFSDPVVLNDAKGILELLALKNYVLTLGNLRMQQWQAIGFSTIGSWEFLSSCGPDQFLELMQDIGSVLFDVLKQEQFLMAHAGSGCFVALVSRHANCDADELEARANGYLLPFNEYYKELSNVPVSIAAGAPQRNGLLSFLPADGPINSAIVSAQKRASTLAAQSTY